MFSARKLHWLLPWCVTGFCLWLLTAKLSFPLDSDFWNVFDDVPLQNWILAAFACWVSFWALGRYDAIAHRHLRTRLNDRHAQFAGKVAIAFSQTVGFGLATGAFARWRMVPGLPPQMAFRLTLFVSVSFLCALGLFAIVLMTGQISVVLALFVALSVIGASLIGLFLYPNITLLGRVIRMPSVVTALSVLGWTAVDIIAAALALFLLMPTGTLTFGDLLFAYVVALTIALISGAPGGVGPFELMLLTLLPDQTSAAIAAGIISYRFLYFALPALASGLCLLFPPKRADFSSDRALVAPFKNGVLSIAETGVVTQSGGSILSRPGVDLACVPLGQTQLALFDPEGPQRHLSFDLLSKLASDTNMVPAAYKVSNRMAALAVRQGWRAVKVAEEAVIDPATFSMDGSKKRQLRRKTRSAEAAGMVVSVGYDTSEVPTLRQIDLYWQTVNKGARGLSTGRFAEDYLEKQIVFTARRDNRIEAYLSLHVAKTEWAIDLMRAGPLCPDGTMHALVAAALSAAKDQGIQNVSLAACPAHPLTKESGQGLRQFKDCFAPRWKPLYLVAPNWPCLALAAVDIAYAIHFPQPLPKERASELTNGPHVCDENYEIASTSTT